jgi:hypothetical protein
VGIRRLLGAVAVALGIALVPWTAHADTALIVGGTNIPPWLSSSISTPNYPLNAEYFARYTFFVVPYPGTIGPFSGIGTPTLGQSVSEGTTNLDTAIHNTSGPILVIGVSQGALAVDAEQAKLENDPNAPPPSQLSFLVIADPQRGGVFSVLFPPGFTIPIVDYTIQAPVESRYNTVVFTNEYDGVADFPDRPWNLVAVANAIAGAVYLHASTSSLNPYTIPPQNITVITNSRGGTTTTYLNPAEHLPLTQPLRDIGVPTQVTNEIDSVLRPIVDAGYSRNDQGPVHGPTFSGGQFHPPTVNMSLISSSTAVFAALTALDPEAIVNGLGDAAVDVGGVAFATLEVVRQAVADARDDVRIALAGLSEPGEITTLAVTSSGLAMSEKASETTQTVTLNVAPKVEVVQAAPVISQPPATPAAPATPATPPSIVRQPATPAAPVTTAEPATPATSGATIDASDLVDGNKVVPGQINTAPSCSRSGVATTVGDQVRTTLDSVPDGVKKITGSLTSSSTSSTDGTDSTDGGTDGGRAGPVQGPRTHSPRPQRQARPR